MWAIAFLVWRLHNPIEDSSPTIEQLAEQATHEELPQRVARRGAKAQKSAPAEIEMPEIAHKETLSAFTGHGVSYGN